MSTATPPASVVVLDSAITWADGCLASALTAPPDLPTPCRGWDLGQLLSHLEDSVVALTEAAVVGQIDVTSPGAGGTGAGPSQTVERVLRRTHTARAVWRQRPTSAPVGVDDLALGRDTVVLVGALEIAVHSWDVARAVGRAQPIPADLAERLYAVALAVVPSADRGTRFAQAVPVSPAAPAGDRLLAHLGRTCDAAGSGAVSHGRAGWSDGADAGDR